MTSPPLPPTLDYARPGEPDALQIDVRPDGGVTITLPTRRSAARYVKAWAEADLLALLLTPLAWLLFVLFATRRPRAQLSLGATEFTATETSDDGLGLWTRSRSWPLERIGELRPNRYGPGLYLPVPAKDSLDLLTDVPGETIVSIGNALAAARERLSTSRHTVIL